MRIDGTSSLRDWHCDSMIIRGWFEATAMFFIDPAYLRSLPEAAETPLPVAARLSIPVRTLKSSVGPAMDGIMRDTMRGQEFRDITYILDQMVLLERPTNAAAPVKFLTRGYLGIAGVTNQVTFPVTMQRINDDIRSFNGSVKLRMSAFRITPPRPQIGGGLITTGDEVTLTWTWQIDLKETGPAAR